MASSDYFDSIQKLYIAYFGRPADPAGLKYWAQVLDDAKGDVSGFVGGFANSAESQALFGASSTKDKVTAIYQNIFGRMPEQSGLDYWVAKIDSGSVSPSMAAWIIINSAQSTDATIVNNKVKSANLFTNNVDTPAEIAGYAGNNAVKVAHDFLSKIDATDQPIEKLTADAIKAVADATGPSNAGDVATPTNTTPTPNPVFTAIPDSNGIVIFTNAGKSVTVTQTGADWVFTTNGPVAGSATVAGKIAGIDTSSSHILYIQSDLAAGIRFVGDGPVKLTDNGAVEAALLKTIEGKASGFLDASSIKTISSATVDDAYLLMVKKQGTNGDTIKTAADVVVEITDTSAFAATLNAIDAATTGLVKAANLTGLNDSVAEIKKTLAAIKAGTIDAPSLRSVNIADAVSADSLNDVTFTKTMSVVLSDLPNQTLTLADSTIAAGIKLQVGVPSLSKNAVTLDGSKISSGFVTLQGSASGDTLIGGDNTSMNGWFGDDTFTATDKSRIDGGEGTDTVKYASVGANILTDVALRLVENIVLVNKGPGFFDFGAQTEDLSYSVDKSVTSPFVLLGGQGKDTFNFTSQQLKDLVINLDGGKGSDTLNVTDASGALDLTGKANNIETVNITGGTTAGSVVVANSMTNVNITGGLANLDVTLGSAGTTTKVESGPGTVTVKGGAGVDAITLNTPATKFVIDETGTGRSTKDNMDTITNFDGSKSIFKLPTKPVAFTNWTNAVASSDTSTLIADLNFFIQFVQKFGAQYTLTSQTTYIMSVLGGTAQGTYLFQNGGSDISSVDSGDVLVKLVGASNIDGKVDFFV